MRENEKFEQWAVVELFGHNMIAGFVSEESIGGSSFVRVDVPETDGGQEFTKLYGAAAIYAITPTTEEIAIRAANRIAVRPIKSWVVPDSMAELPPEIVDGDDLFHD